MDKNSVLSFSLSKEALVLREEALQGAGIKVTSVLTPAEARFEIEMGRCGNLLICYRLSVQTADEIARLYRRYCPEGRIVFIADGAEKKVPAEADVQIRESSNPQNIVQALRVETHGQSAH